MIASRQRYRSSKQGRPLPRPTPWQSKKYDETRRAGLSRREKASAAMFGASGAAVGRDAIAVARGPNHLRVAEPARPFEACSR